jgi:predicted DNA-binding transcriptional regulator AlpA
MIPELVDAKQIMEIIGVKSRKKFKKMCDAGEIPPPINLSTKPRHWRKDAIVKLLGGP